jgi:hypothetical protein
LPRISFGFLLEAHELDADHVEAFVGLDQELSKQIVHATALARGNAGQVANSVQAGSVWL